MPGSIRRTTSAPSLPKIIEDVPLLEAAGETACSWQSKVKAASGVAWRVTGASAAHFAVGFVAGKGALTTFGMATNHRQSDAFLLNTGLVVGTFAATYGAILGAGCARGTCRARDIFGSLLSMVVAGAMFPAGAIVGGYLAARYTDHFDPQAALTPSGLAPSTLGPSVPTPLEAHPSFAMGAEKGAFLSAMAGYAACRWALGPAAPKDKDEGLPVTVPADAVAKRMGSRWRDALIKSGVKLSGLNKALSKHHA